MVAADTGHVGVPGHRPAPRAVGQRIPAHRRLSAQAGEQCVRGPVLVPAKVEQVHLREGGGVRGDGGLHGHQGLLEWESDRLYDISSDVLW